MKRTVRNNVSAPYTLHDMNVVAFEVAGNDLIVRMQSGMVEPFSPYGSRTDMWSFIRFNGISVMCTYWV